MSGRGDWVVSLHYTDDIDRPAKYITVDDLAGGLIMGRGKDDTAINIVSSSVVSKVHCRFNISRDGAIYLGDLGSAHGTTIKPCNYPSECPILHTEYPIRVLEGDVISLGKTIISGEKVHQPLHLVARFRYPHAHNACSRQGLQEIDEDAYKSFVGREDNGDIKRLKISLQEDMDKKDGKEENAIQETSTPLRHPLSQSGSSGKYGVPPSMLYGSDDDDEPLPRSTSASPLRRIPVDSVGISLANALIPSSPTPVDPPTPLVDEEELYEDDGYRCEPSPSPEPNYHPSDMAAQALIEEQQEKGSFASDDEDAEFDLNQSNNDHQLFPNLLSHVESRLIPSDQGDGPEPHSYQRGVWYSYSSDSEGGEEEEQADVYGPNSGKSEEKQPKIEEEVEAEKLARRQQPLDFMKSRRSARSSQTSTSSQNQDGSPRPIPYESSPPILSSPNQLIGPTPPRHLAFLPSEIDSLGRQNPGPPSPSRSDSPGPSPYRSDSSGPEEGVSRSDGETSDGEIEESDEELIKQEEEAEEDEMGGDIGVWSKDGNGEWVEDSPLDEAEEEDTSSPLQRLEQLYAREVEEQGSELGDEGQEGDDAGFGNNETNEYENESGDGEYDEDYDEIEEYDDEDDEAEGEEDQMLGGQGDSEGEEEEVYELEYPEGVEDTEDGEVSGYEDEEEVLREAELEEDGMEDDVNAVADIDENGQNQVDHLFAATRDGVLENLEHPCQPDPAFWPATGAVNGEENMEDEEDNDEDVGFENSQGQASASIDGVDQEEENQEDGEENTPAEPAYIDGSSQTEDVLTPAQPTTFLGSPLTFPADHVDSGPIIPVSTLINQINIPAIPNSTNVDIIQSTESELDDIAQVLEETREIVGLPKVKRRKWKTYKWKNKVKGNKKGKKEYKSFPLTTNTTSSSSDNIGISSSSSVPFIPEAIQQSHIPLESASDTSSNGPITPKYKLRPLKRTAGMAGLDEEVDQAIIIVQGESNRDEALPLYSGDTIQVGRGTPKKRFKKVGEVMGLIMLGAALGSVGTIAGLMQMA